MRYLFILFALFFYFSFSFAQQHSPVSLVAGASGTELHVRHGSPSYQVARIQLSFLITDSIPDKFIIHLSIPLKNTSKPVLRDSDLTVEREDILNKKEFTKVVSLQYYPADSLSSEPIAIIQKGDPDNICTINFASVKQVAGPVTDKPEVKAKNLVHLKEGSTNINPIYSKDSERIEKIAITLVRDMKPSDGDTDHITFKVDKKTFPYKPEISPLNLTLTTSDWGKGPDYTIKKILRLNNSFVDTMHGDQLAYLQIGDEETFHTIRLTESGMLNKPFWLELGTNFDLLDGIDPNNFYSGVYMFEKDMARLGKRDLSFTGGIYESKSAGSSISSDSGLIYRDGASYLYDSAHKGFPYYRDIGPVTTVTSVRTLGFFFSPYWRLNKPKVIEDGFHCFVSLYAEMLWQKVSSTVDYGKTKRDTTMYIPRSLNKDSSIYNLPFKETQASSDFRSHYFGIGLPIYIKEPRYNFYLNSVFGFSTQKFILVQSPVMDKSSKVYIVDTFPNRMVNPGIIKGFATLKRSWNPFYLFQFRLNEEIYGITITGEIRGFIFKNAKPVVSLSLSKKFDIAELFRSIVKPFSPGAASTSGL